MSDRERSRSRSPEPPASVPAPAQDPPSGNGNGNGNHESSDPVKLYIGNIDYGTTDESLRAYFEKHGNVTDAFVPKEKGTSRPRGFGFVTFATREEAMSAMEKLDGTELDGRTIRISESKPREKSNGPFNANGSAEVKLFVGNLSFDTQTDSIKALFESIGPVNDCYMPTDRGNNRPRGFAFVTMPSSQAEEAMKRLTGQDLDGRAIRIEEAGGKKASRDDFRGGGGGAGAYGGGGGGGGGDRYGSRGGGYDRDRGYEDGAGGGSRGGHGGSRGGYGSRRDERGGGRDDRDRRRDNDDRYDDRRGGGGGGSGSGARSRSRSPGYRSRRDDRGYGDRRSRSPPRSRREGGDRYRDDSRGESSRRTDSY